MASATTVSVVALSLVMFLSSPTSFAASSVSVSHTFTFVNAGELGEYITEYGADYRVLDIAASPFQLCFYNTTPDAFTFGIRMGRVRSESRMRWVWDANRGYPVRENATLALRRDGNLVLSDSDGRVAWQTSTANSGVVGLSLLPTGNLVLRNSRGSFVWQSFDHPTDTLLVGQSLRGRLVSRLSDVDNSLGPYSFVLRPGMLGLYYKPISGAGRKYLYFSSDELFSVYRRPLESATLTSSPADTEGHAYDLTLKAYGRNGSATSAGSRILARPKYNATLSFLRVASDGNLRIYTYDDRVDWGAWEVTYTLFSREDSSKDECRLPARCGQFGLCEDSQCVACPMPGGLAGWSRQCRTERSVPCGASNVRYYKLQGVEHFGRGYTEGEGPVSEASCRQKCTGDCKCSGYFYHGDSSTCWPAYDLQTLTRTRNSTHVAYIKYTAAHAT